MTALGKRAAPSQTGARNPIFLAIATVILPGGMVMACGGATPPPGPAPMVSADPLGPRPEPPPPPQFTPPTPVVLEGPGGSRLWILERHEVELVRVTAISPYGRASDPPDGEGLAVATTSMFDEGAGKRGAAALTLAIADLGAKLEVEAGRDASIVTLYLVASKLEPALALLAEMMIRPRHNREEWQDVRRLLRKPALLNDGGGADIVARNVAARWLFGSTHAYARPITTSIDAISIGKISRWHRTTWRPDVTTFVITGDVEPEAVRGLFTKAFASWRAPTEQPPPVIKPDLPAPGPCRTFVVDSGGPQSLIYIAHAAPAADDPDWARTAMIDHTLSGQLIDNLRFAHQWTYADDASAVVRRRGVGSIITQMLVPNDALADALRETRHEMATFVDISWHDASIERLRRRLNQESLEKYSTLVGAAKALEDNASFGLPPDHDTRTLRLQRSATRADLAQNAKRFTDLSTSVVVLVAPKETAVRALAINGLPDPQLVDSDGRPVNK